MTRALLVVSMGAVASGLVSPAARCVRPQQGAWSRRTRGVSLTKMDGVVTRLASTISDPSKLMDARVEAAVEAAVAATLTKLRRTQPGWLTVTLAFFLGGLFFSSVLAALTAVYALGFSNVRRASLTAQIAARRVWVVAKVAVGTARKALFSKKKGKMAEARSALVEGWRNAKLATFAGVDALKMERSYVARELGTPGLAAAQYFLERWAPLNGAATIEQALREALLEVQIPRRVKRCELRSFELGTALPRLVSARLYDVGADAIAFDVEAVWDSAINFNARLIGPAGVRLPSVVVSNLRFQGTLRVVVAHLTPSDPGYGAILLSLATAPRLSLDVKLAGGELTKVPWLKQEIISGIQASLNETLVWPKRIVQPAEFPDSKRKVLTTAQLLTLENDDPLLSAERRLAANDLLNETNQRRQQHDGATKKVNLKIDVAAS